MNSGEFTSGIQICTGRSPILRSFARCARTFSADDFGCVTALVWLACFRRVVFALLTAMVTCNLSRSRFLRQTLGFRDSYLTGDQLGQQRITQSGESPGFRNVRGLPRQKSLYRTRDGVLRKREN